jgi:hypothetical protein
LVIEGAHGPHQRGVTPAGLTGCTADCGAIGISDPQAVEHVRDMLLRALYVASEAAADLAHAPAARRETPPTL